MCLIEWCACSFAIRYKCYNRWELYHPVDKKKITCYKCKGLEVRPRRKIVFPQDVPIKETGLKSKCDFCGSFDYLKEMLREEFTNKREFLRQEKFMFCKYSSCSEVFGKYLLHDPINPCLITPYVFRKKAQY
jgi:hypothetical protein